MADRLRGIVSAYRFCKETNRPFRIGFFEPFDLREYFLPNLYDWSVEKCDIIYDLSLSIPKVIRCITENNDELCLHRKRFIQMLNQRLDKFIYIQTHYVLLMNFRTISMNYFVQAPICA